MKKLKKIWSVIFVITFVFTMMQIPITYVQASEKNDTAYIAEGDEKVYMDENKPIEKRITLLKIDSINEINFEVSSKIDNSDNFILKENGIVTKRDLYNVNFDESGLKGCIKFNKKINLNNVYSLEIPKYGVKNTEFRKVYESKEFEDLYSYDGKLGAIYNNKETEFKLWAPTATDVKVAFTEKMVNHIL